MILEVNLHDFVAETEHDGMLCSHPFFDVDGAGWVLELVGLVQFVPLNELLLFLRIVVLLQVGLEVLQQSDLLLKILRVTREVILLHHILLFVCCDSFSFVIVELRTA